MERGCLGGKLVPRQTLGIARLGSRHRYDRGVASCQAELAKTFRPPMIGESQPSGLFRVNISTKDSELVFGRIQNVMNKIAHPAVGRRLDNNHPARAGCCINNRHAGHNPCCDVELLTRQKFDDVDLRFMRSLLSLGQLPTKGQRNQ